MELYLNFKGSTNYCPPSLSPSPNQHIYSIGLSAMEDKSKKTKKQNRFSQFDTPKADKSKSAPKKDVPAESSNKGVFERERKKLEAQKKRNQQTVGDKDKSPSVRAPDRKILNINERKMLQNT